MSPYIPQELIDGILHELQNDIHTLKRCALVARCFVPPCQRLIFSRIYLDTSTAGLVSCRKLQALLLSSPHLIEYAEVLSVQLRSHTSDKSNVLPVTLSALSYLQSFRLSGPTAWERLSHIQRQAICDTFAFPRLVSASVIGIRGFPLSIFMHCSQLTHISINDIIVDVPDPIVESNSLPQPAPPEVKGQLTTLSGGEGTAGALATRVLVHSLVHPHSSLSLCALRNFTAAVRFDEDVIMYRRLIHLARMSLESLTLSVDCKAPAQLAWMDIGQLAGLRNLSITIFDNPFLPVWLLRLLSSVSNVNKIRELVITVFFSNFVEATWGEIDATLAEPKFSSLRIISLRYWKKEQVLLPELCFPLMVSKDILRVFNEGDRVFPRNTPGSIPEV